MSHQIGDCVRVSGSMRLMRLMAVESVIDMSALREGRRTVRTAFVRPVGGGCERSYPLEQVETVCDHPTLHQRNNGTYCASCGALIYPAQTA